LKSARGFETPAISPADLRGLSTEQIALMQRIDGIAAMINASPIG